MPTIKYKSNPNEDTAYCDGHKVQLVAVPSGTLQSPIHPTSDAGYVIDGNGEKHRVLMAYFMSGTPDYKSNETCDTAYLTVSGRKIKVRLACKERGDLTLSTKANVNKGYVVGGDGEKHRVTLVNTPTGTLQLPNNETDDSAYVVDNNGKKTKVRLFLLLSGGSVEVIVKGVSPLSLPDAVANTLSYVKAFGGTEQNGTPTPTNPIDIVSNNGVLKYGFNYYSYNVTRQLSVANYPVELDRSISYSDGVLTCSITGSVGSNKGLYPTWDMSFTAGHKYACVVMAKGDARINLGLTSIIPSGSVTGGSSSDGFYTLTSNYVWYAKRWECNTDSSARLNIRVAGTDVGQYASFKDILVIDLTAIFGAGNEPTTSSDIIQRTVEIYTDGTVETINVHGKNLFDETYPNLTSSPKYKAIYVGDGTFTCSYSIPNQSLGVSMIYFLPGNVSAGANNRVNQVDAEYPRTVTAVNGYVTIAYRNGDSIGLSGQTPEDYNCMIEKGSPATAYVPYYDGGTATAEMLLKISSDYQDQQEIIDGTVTRNVGVKVLDGTESWSVATTSVLQADVLPNDAYGQTCICSHLKYTTSSTLSGMPENSFRNGSATYKNRLYVKSSVYATDATTWTNYLKAQYNAGTPVTVIYPLAQAVTEQVAPQVLNVQTGDNILEITQASLDGLELEAQYQAAVSLTIQEVQDANLDPNVEVTIN